MNIYDGIYICICIYEKTKFFMIDQETLKGQCHEIFDPFFSLISPTWSPDKLSKLVLYSVSFLFSYLRFKVNPRCHAHRGVIIPRCHTCRGVTLRGVYDTAE